MEPPWEVSLLSSAEREFDGLDDGVRRAAASAISDLAEDPIPFGAVPLRGYRNLYRIRVYFDQYRIVYRLSVKQRKVIIWRVRSRASAYRGL